MIKYATTVTMKNVTEYIFHHALLSAVGLEASFTQEA